MTLHPISAPHLRHAKHHRVLRVGVRVLPHVAWLGVGVGLGLGARAWAWVLPHVAWFQLGRDKVGIGLEAKARARVRV